MKLYVKPVLELICLEPSERISVAICGDVTTGECGPASQWVTVHYGP